jgi:hypothetical protein
MVALARVLLVYDALAVRLRDPDYLEDRLGPWVGLAVGLVLVFTR